jgi:hypothetical protein
VPPAGLEYPNPRLRPRGHWDRAEDVVALFIIDYPSIFCRAEEEIFNDANARSVLYYICIFLHKYSYTIEEFSLFFFC